MMERRETGSPAPPLRATVGVDQIREDARRHVRRKRIYYTILGGWLALSLMWFTIDMLDGSDSLWFYWPMGGTGIAVVITGVALFGIDGLLGADWEQREIDRYLQRRAQGPGR
jgi:2TM domain